MKSREFFLYNRPEGLQEERFYDGTLKSISDYQNGRQANEWKAFYESGILKSYMRFDGKYRLIKGANYNENGYETYSTEVVFNEDNVYEFIRTEKSYQNKKLVYESITGNGIEFSVKKWSPAGEIYEYRKYIDGNLRNIELTKEMVFDLSHGEYREMQQRIKDWYAKKEKEFNEKQALRKQLEDKAAAAEFSYKLKLLLIVILIIASLLILLQC